MKNFTRISTFLAISLVVLSCKPEPKLEPKPEPPIDPPVETTAPSIVGFTIAKSDNPLSLTADISAVFVKGAQVDTIRLQTTQMIKDLRLKAMITTKGAVSVMADDKAVVSSETVLDYGNMQRIEVKNDKGEKKEYVAIVEQFTGLPIVYLTTNGGAPIVSKDDYLDGNVRFVDNNHEGSSRMLDAATQVKGRGNSTWPLPKKPYKIKLKSKASVFGFPADKEWVLLANYLDPSFLKNTLAFEISSRTNLDYSPRKENVELVLNGVHKGNYVLTEQIKIASSRVNVADLKGSDMSGGYLLELDTYFDEDNKFKSAIKNLPVMIKEPDVTPDQIAWLENYFREAETAIYSESFKDPVNGYAKYIDVDSWIDWWIVYEVMCNWEPNHPKSTYMSKDKGGKLTMGPVWDFDYVEFNNKTDRFYMKGEPSKEGMPLYYEQLLKDPVFNAKLKARYKSLRANEISNLNLYLKTQQIRMNKSAVADYAIWRTGSSSYEQNFNTVYNLIINHMTWLDKNIDTL